MTDLVTRRLLLLCGPDTLPRACAEVLRAELISPVLEYLCVSQALFSRLYYLTV